MIPTIRLTDPSPHDYNVCVCMCVCVCVVKASKIYSLSNFPIYDTVLLTIVTVLNIRSTEFIHLIKEICTI